MPKINLRISLIIVGLFVLSRGIFIGIFEFATGNFAILPDKVDYFHYSANPILNHLGNWDTGWYLDIANRGYVFTPLEQGQSNYGFFPLYPLLMKAFGYFVHDNFIGGIIISNILLITGAFFLYLLVIELSGSRKTGVLALIVLFFFPGSYLFSGVFSESAFLCFSVMSVYFFERERYFLSGTSGFLLALTRPFGVLLLAPLALRYLQRSGLTFEKRALWLPLIPAGTFAFFLYCYFTTGDFFMYTHAKEHGWGTRIRQPLFILYEGLVRPENRFILFNSIYSLALLILIFVFFRFVPLYLTIWTLILILFPMASGTISVVCMPRYIVVCFPFLMQMAGFMNQNVWKGRLLFFLLAVINFILCAFYSLGYQFAA